ncbi:Histidine kinase-, DNA gyrase B-, and HSP90-like ATPase [Pedobacter terrae]|uniref:Histidine kinase-, DNA gyrase B-, and HSP90-like ATPase n=1 Tax=Pedobacter terrae TaxID=405671 RepID=A0A1G7XG30_9SPHI|nr:ATP-binding protein [Pedobacter terrae]SDG83198.1 Histidine kinase-, DNA gyrase B-, and HSP90-like ATPase [Pedobacter terrae]
MEISQKATSFAELEAKKALNLKPFLSINLENIKSKVDSILGHIGKTEIFNEYTKHDISHIDTMLMSLDWIIPEETKKRLTCAEWLMIVLSVYFHDLGMLVTKDEYEERGKNESFLSYKTKVVTGGYTENFKLKVQGLGKGAESFMYQEYVRQHHAERIKNWVTEKKTLNLGGSKIVVEELKAMLGEIDNVFKKDLGMICESHHLDDLEDINKYKINQFYGSHPQEKANLQYCAVILRTADLLHITSDRTPSIEYRLINPNDPISQIEWAKQMAVRNVSPKAKFDKEGVVDKNQQPDTVEVSAYFDNATNATSFFGLIDYLAYARKELERSHKWVTESSKKHAIDYEFPWKNIDDSRIETEGFERKLFTFELDQQRILNLLVGHTLYNDPTVVIRELVQNSVDAIKLLAYTKDKLSTEGKIIIEWIENDRKLIFRDNGIGMTQEIIEKHLLKVGSSRYQDENFKKEHPGFSAISRFGIGLLTCFLIADDLDITTVSEFEEKAKKISIRKVDGKYLMQHIDKDDITEISDHGTQIVLNVRQDVDLDDLEESLQKWILYPDCKVEFVVKDKRTAIGFTSPKDAVVYQLKRMGLDVGKGMVKVGEYNRNGINLAFALRYSQYLDQWTFIRGTVENENHSIGTAVEGIRVEFNSPGFISGGPVAAVNCTGENAPKTNVARSHFEMNSYYTDYLQTVYDIYGEHISEEINRMIDSEMPLTKAISEGYYIMSALTSSRSGSKTSPIDEKLLVKALLKVPAIAVEEGGKREKETGQRIIDMEEIWTIESPQLRKAESFLEEIPGAVSTAELFKFITKKSLNYENIVFCNFRYSYILHQEIFSRRSLAKIKIDIQEKRVDFKWIKKEPGLWIERTIEREPHRSTITTIPYMLQMKDIEIVGIPTSTELIISQGFRVVLKEGVLHDVINTLYLKEKNLMNSKEEGLFPIVINRLFTLIESAAQSQYKIENIESRLKRHLREEYSSLDDLQEFFYECVDKDKLISIMTSLAENTINFYRMDRSRISTDYDFS